MVSKTDYLEIMSLGIIMRRCAEGMKEKEGPKYQSGRFLESLLGNHLF